MDLLEALDHPQLFAPFFKGETWRPWKAALAALFGLEMDAGELALFQHHTGRTSPPSTAFREACFVVGRRGGKSRVLSLVAVYLAVFNDYSPYLAPGEIGTIAVIAADRKQARSIFRFTIGLLRGVPALAELIEADGEDYIQLNNRVRIEIATASFRVTRGYSFAAVLCDETAFWRDENSANPDVEIFRALRPGLASIPGAILLNASSPYRKAGVLYNTFKRHYGRDDARVLVWRGTTAEMNPTIAPVVIAEAYEDDPASAAAEFGAEFRDDIADFVSREIVDACTVRGRGELLPVPGIAYRAFVDPSGGSSDSMTLAVAHLQGEVRVLDAVREIRPPFSPENAIIEFCALLKSYRVEAVTGDRYAGEFPREQFRKQGVAYKLSEQPKGEIYRDTLPLLNSGKVELLDMPRLASQLCGLERRTARGGRDSIDHAPSAHDDVANAACGALLLLNARGPIRISDEAMAASMIPWNRGPW